MKPEEIAVHYPRLFHMANLSSWPSVRRDGLLSTRSLVDLYEVDGALREEILSTRRRHSIPLEHGELGTAVVRDQLPLREKALEKCLTDMTLGDWLETLNSRVFFWLDEPHLENLLGARAYKEDAHDVIIVDTATLVDRDGPKVRLSPINSGSTLYNPRPRGSQTFLSIEDYPFAERRRARGKNAIVELAVEGGVERIEEVAVRAERRRCGGVIEEVLWERP
ncbi:MAG: hypothetical protein JST53_14685 [Actinobacteria bacterium]|nr:hypothetical protein [Actinomycetota bacterium]